MGVPLSQDDNILFPATLAVKNPRNQYQTPIADSEGEVRADTELGLANHRVTDADAKQFAAAPDPDFPSTGRPKFNDYKFMVEQIGPDAPAKERLEKAPTIESVIGNTLNATMTRPVARR